MPIDFDKSDDVNCELVTNGDGSKCIRLSKPDGSHAVNVIGIRTDGTYQKFTMPAEDAAAIGLQQDATGFVRWVG